MAKSYDEWEEFLDELVEGKTSANVYSVNGWQRYTCELQIVQGMYSPYNLSEKEICTIINEYMSENEELEYLVVSDSDGYFESDGQVYTVWIRSQYPEQTSANILTDTKCQLNLDSCIVQIIDTSTSSNEVLAEFSIWDYID